MKNGKVIKLSEDTLKKFEGLVSICNEEHFGYCSCQNERIQESYDILLEEAKDELDTLDESLKKQHKGKLYRIAKAATIQHCIVNNIRCPHEIEEIKSTLLLFNNDYDLDDSKVYMIVKSVLNHQLSSIRMQKYSNSKGILQENWDKMGNKTYKLNPVEQAKRSFDDSIIRAIEILERTINGSKTNIMIDFEEPIDISNIANITDASQFISE